MLALSPAIFAFFHALTFLEGVLASVGMSALAAKAKAVSAKSREGYRLAAKIEVLGLLFVVVNVFRLCVRACVGGAGGRWRRS